MQTLDTLSQQDLRAYAEFIDDVTLPAGGVEFFEAILASRGHRPVEQTMPSLAGNRLFVCGSPAAWSVGRVQQAAGHGIATVRIEPRAADRCSAWTASRTATPQLAIMTERESLPIVRRNAGERRRRGTRTKPPRLRFFGRGRDGNCRVAETRMDATASGGGNLPRVRCCWKMFEGGCRGLLLNQEAIRGRRWFGNG